MLYSRNLYYEHFTPFILLHNNLCNFTTQEHKFKMAILYPKPGFYSFKKFLVYKNKSES